MNNRERTSVSKVGQYAVASVVTIAILVGAGALVTYRMATTTGVVVAQFLQASAIYAE